MVPERVKSAYYEYVDKPPLRTSSHVGIFSIDISIGILADSLALSSVI